MWFLKELRKILDPNRIVTFISDRNACLIERIKIVFPEQYHEYCLYHLKFNFHEKFRGVKGNFRERIVYKFNLCVYAPKAEGYHKELNSLLLEGG